MSYQEAIRKYHAANHELQRRTGRGNALDHYGRAWVLKNHPDLSSGFSDEVMDAL